MELAKILAKNQEFLKINNIEKAIGLKKTTLVRMIARKEIPEKHKEKIEKWWKQWVSQLFENVWKPENTEVPLPKDHVNLQNVFTIDRQGKKISVVGEPVTVTVTEKNHVKFGVDNSEIEKQILAIQNEKIPEARNTAIGKKIWYKEQENRIEELKKQLKCGQLII